MANDWANLESDALNASSTRATCGVKALYDALPVPARASVALAISNPNVSASGLRKALMARGVEAPSVRVIQRHRSGECNCERD